MVGHNPGLQMLVYQLTGESESMPTAAIAVIQFQINSWQDFVDTDAPPGNLAALWRPKEIE